METEKKLQMVRVAYAGALAEALKQYDKFGIIEKVREEKRREQFSFGRDKAKQFGIENPRQVFQRLAEIFECAQWIVEEKSDGFTAETKSCMLSALAKKLGAPRPCEIYCLDPMEGMILGIKPTAVFSVKKILWQDDKCSIKVTC